MQLVQPIFSFFGLWGEGERDFFFFFSIGVGVPSSIHGMEEQSCGNLFIVRR